MDSQSDTTDLQIRSELGRYLRGEISLPEFQAWFSPVTWNIHRSANPVAPDLAYEVGGRLAEFTSGEYSESELRAILEPLAETYWAQYGESVEAPKLSLSDRPIRTGTIAVAGR